MNTCNTSHNIDKSLDNLVHKLVGRQAKKIFLKQKEKDSSKMKQLSVANYCSPNGKHDTPIVMKIRLGKCSKRCKTPLKNRQKAKNKLPKSEVTSCSKLTEWLAKSSKETVNKSDNISCNFKENNEINNKQGIDANMEKERYENYLRYGIRMPTYGEIVKFQERNRAYKELIDNVKFEELVQNKVSPIKLESNKEAVISLNCMSLTPSKIQEMFYNNLKYAKEIFNGTIYSERHEKFKRQNLKDNYTDKDLRYSPSMSVFTVDQKNILLSLLHDEFDDENPFRLNQYYFKVLLPELCLKIFMDVYKMKKRAALLYLENMPVEDD